MEYPAGRGEVTPGAGSSAAGLPGGVSVWRGCLPRARLLRRSPVPVSLSACPPAYSPVRFARRLSLAGSPGCAGTVPVPLLRLPAFPPASVSPPACVRGRGVV